MALLEPFEPKPYLASEFADLIARHRPSTGARTKAPPTESKKAPPTKSKKASPAKRR